MSFSWFWVQSLQHTSVQGLWTENTLSRKIKILDCEALLVKTQYNLKEQEVLRESREALQWAGGSQYVLPPTGPADVYKGGGEVWITWAMTPRTQLPPPEPRPQRRQTPASLTPSPSATKQQDSLQKQDTKVLASCVCIQCSSASSVLWWQGATCWQMRRKSDVKGMKVELLSASAPLFLGEIMYFFTSLHLFGSCGYSLLLRLMCCIQKYSKATLL